MEGFNQKKNSGNVSENVFKFNFKETVNNKPNMDSSKKVKVGQNKSSFSWISLVIVVLLLLLVGLGTFAFISKMISDEVNNQIKKEYTVSTPIDYPAKNMNNCPPGCLRGVCSEEALSSQEEEGSGKPCEYDFQCNYCKDPSTNQFYVNFSQNPKRKIVPVYEEEWLGTIAEKKLNDEIKKNNEYIKKLNQHIKEVNEEEFKYS